LLLDPKNALIYQSISAQESVEAVNGDGFGLAWYGDFEEPGSFRSIYAAWNDENLKSLASHIKSHLFLAHVRASTGTPVQRSNCHPFTYGKWSFAHNGVINEFNRCHRDLIIGVRPDLFSKIVGNTDSELMFYLALSFGMDKDVQSGLERMAGFIEEVCSEHGIESALQMSLGISDGQNIWAVRYSSEGRSRSLYYSDSMEKVQKVVPALIDRFEPHARAVASEPLNDNIYQEWIKVPESSFLHIRNGHVDIRSFRPSQESE
jgi:glutamine amidotransferase